MKKTLIIIFNLILIILLLKSLLETNLFCHKEDVNIDKYLDTVFRKQNNLPLFQIQDYEKSVNRSKVVKFSIKNRKNYPYLDYVNIHSKNPKEIDHFMIDENVILEQWTVFGKKIKTRYYLIKKNEKIEEKLTSEEGANYKKKYNL